MTIRWVMKTAPKRTPVPASAEDVVAGPDPKLPVSLSPKAIAEGWRGVAYSAPEKVPADSLAKGLRDYVYDGVSVWWLFGRPMLKSLAGADAALFAPAPDEEGIGRRGRAGTTPRTHYERPGAGLSFAVARRKDRRADGFSLRFEDALLRRCPLAPATGFRSASKASHILMMGDTGSGKSNAIRQLLGQVRKRGESAIADDPAMDFVSESPRPRAVI